MLKQYQGKHYLVLSEGVIAQHERTMKKRRRKIVPEKLNWKPPVFTRCVSLFWSALLSVLLKNFGGFLSERHMLFKEVLFLESALALTNSFLFPFESLHFSFAIHQRATSVRLVIDQKERSFFRLFFLSSRSRHGNFSFLSLINFLKFNLFPSFLAMYSLFSSLESTCWQPASQFRPYLRIRKATRWIERLKGFNCQS